MNTNPAIALDTKPDNPNATKPWLQLGGIIVLTVLFAVVGIKAMVPAEATTQGMATVALVIVFLGAFITAGVLWWCGVTRWQDRQRRTREHVEDIALLELLEHAYGIMASQNSQGGVGSWNGSENLHTRTFLWAFRKPLQDHGFPGLKTAAEEGRLHTLLGVQPAVQPYHGYGASLQQPQVNGHAPTT